MNEEYMQHADEAVLAVAMVPVGPLLPQDVGRGVVAGHPLANRPLRRARPNHNS